MEKCSEGTIHKGEPEPRNGNVKILSTFIQKIVYDKGPGKRGHIVAETLLPTQMFPRLPARNICCGHKFCVRDTKNVSDFVQKHFVSATNKLAQHGNTTWATMCPQQCVLVCQYLKQQQHLLPGSAEGCNRS